MNKAMVVHKIKEKGGYDLILIHYFPSPLLHLKNEEFLTIVVIVIVRIRTLSAGRKYILASTKDFRGKSIKKQKIGFLSWSNVPYPQSRTKRPRQQSSSSELEKHFPISHQSVKLLTFNLRGSSREVSVDSESFFFSVS